MRLPNDTPSVLQSTPRAGLILLPEEGRIAILRIHSIISSALDLAVRYDWGVPARASVRKLGQVVQ